MSSKPHPCEKYSVMAFDRCIHVKVALKSRHGTCPCPQGSTYLLVAQASLHVGPQLVSELLSVTADQRHAQRRFLHFFSFLFPGETDENCMHLRGTV